MDAPTDDNISAYLDLLIKKSVKTVCRTCKPTYSTDPLTEKRIVVEELPFKDGAPPPEAVLDQWLRIISLAKGSGNCVAVHCVAGLGRAPILVAVALIEDGMEAENAINFIRKHRKGVFNTTQLNYLYGYKPRAGCCVIL